MRKAVVARRHSLRLLGIVGVGLLAGCNMTHLEGPPAAMSFKSGGDVMIGQYNFPSVRPGSFGRVDVTAELNVSNGELTCSGTASYREQSVTQVVMPIACTDGAQGTARLVLNPDAWRVNISGVGIGTLSNGKQFRIIVGPMRGELDW